MTARKRGRPTPPPPPNVRQVTVSGNGITVEDALGKVFVRWSQLKFLRTKRIAIDTYRAMGFREVDWRYNNRGTMTATVLHKPLPVVESKDAA